MSKAAHISAALLHLPQRQSAPQEPQAEDTEDTPEERTIKRVYMLMQGRYGKSWIEKWTTGMLNDAGADRGMLNAMRVWRNELRAYPQSVIEEAATRWKSTDQGRKWPPSLPEFEALCVDLQRQHVAAKAFAQAAKPKAHPDYIEASPEAIAAHRAAVRELSTARMRAASQEVASDGLPGLLHLAAKAAALAGGDEARTLRRLERRMLGGRAA